MPQMNRTKEAVIFILLVGLILGFGFISTRMVWMTKKLHQVEVTYKISPAEFEQRFNDILETPRGQMQFVKAVDKLVRINPTPPPKPQPPVQAPVQFYPDNARGFFINI